MNTSDNDNRLFPPIQLLVPSWQTVDDAGIELKWLHGFCVVNYRPVGAGLQLYGMVRIGERYGENLAMIRDLAEALDPEAVLAGDDLTSIISGLGRLPIEANDPQPALAVLSKLKSMLDLHDPIDLSIDDASQTAVLIQHLRARPGTGDETLDAIQNELFESVRTDEASVTPQRIAADLVDSARACMLAIGELYLADELQPLLLTAWETWECTVLPQLLPLSLIQENGGEPIIIN